MGADVTHKALLLLQVASWSCHNDVQGGACRVQGRACLCVSDDDPANPNPAFPLRASKGYPTTPCWVATLDCWTSLAGVGAMRR